MTSLTSNDAWELVTLRASLESLAASLAANRATPAAKASLQAAFDDLVISAASHQTARATSADFAFHRAIIAAANHERLAEHYRRVSQQISIVIASSNALLSDPMVLVSQHEPLFRAIAGGKAKRASGLAREHIEAEGSKLIAHLVAVETPKGSASAGQVPDKKPKPKPNRLKRSTQ